MCWLIEWPKGMSYSSWINLLKRACGWCRTKKIPRTNRQKKGCTRRYKRRAQEQTEKLSEKQATEVMNDLKTCDPLKSGDIKLELITVLKQFLERKHLSKHIEESIPDYRNQDLITYSKQSLITSALVIFLLRMTSGNKFDNKSHDDEKYARKNIAKFIDAPEDRVPVIKTIEKFLKKLDEEHVNNLMVAFFQDLQRSKFFVQHPQIMYGDCFFLAADCVHTHSYDHPHHEDKYGNNDCACCLKRVYNRGTEHEITKWMHNTLVLCFVFQGGLKIPIYRHPIHATQVVNVESASEDAHKQECELVALKIALPLIRQLFPKMKIALLLDGLYANRSVIRLAADWRCGYIIVKKEGCMTLLAKDCDGQSKLENHRKNCIKRCRQSNHQGQTVDQKYEWFNSVDIGDESERLTTNVLRFLETKMKDGKELTYKCEWLFSWKISAKTCEASARQARMRWEEEDLFNTLKNRGFNLGHDYSRDPRSFHNWQGLAFFAFAIFELFRFSQAVKQRSNFSQSTLAEKLQSQLLCRPTEELFSERCLSARIQFRYDFKVEVMPSTEIRQSPSQCALRPG
jgi:hypothetical protein